MFAASIIAPSVSAQVRVNGYTKKDGTYVAPHYRSSPNSSTSDNYSTKGNVNPYTGAIGTKETYSRSTSNSYGSPNSAPKKSTTPCYYNCPN